MQRIATKIALRGFRSGARGAGHVLGELESAVMEVLWAKPKQTVIEVEQPIQRTTWIDLREIRGVSVLRYRKYGGSGS